MSPIIQNPQDVQARYANRLARQHYAVREAWWANPVPELGAIVAELAWQREDHQEHTGWLAEYDGETTVYHYTNPAERPQL